MQLAPWLIAILAALAAVLGVATLRLRRELRRRSSVEQNLREREQRAQDVAESRKRFVVHLSHEARNLIGNILGTLTMAEHNRHVPTLPKLARALRTNAQSLQDLLNESLDAAQLDAGSFAVRATCLDLVKLLENLAAEVAPLAGHEVVLVGIEGEHALADPWWVDGVRLAQIVRNLVANALRHAPLSEVRVHARVLPDANPTGWRLCLHVIDHGPGLSAEQQQRLFGEFARVGEARTVGSVGLGLMISRRLARAMGGDLRVCSAPGMGTTFSLWLPVHAQGDEPAVATPSSRRAQVTTPCC
jgi:signal transduction histidine kinase